MTETLITLANYQAYYAMLEAIMQGIDFTEVSTHKSWKAALGR